MILKYTWTPKVCKIKAQNHKKQPKRPLIILHTLGVQVFLNWAIWGSLGTADFELRGSKYLISEVSCSKRPCFWWVWVSFTALGTRTRIPKVCKIVAETSKKSPKDNDSTYSWGSGRHKWVVAQIRIPFWVPSTLGAVLY